MKYYLVWNGETIEDDIETLEDAKYLKAEYEIAFKGCVSIKRRR